MNINKTTLIAVSVLFLNSCTHIDFNRVAPGYSEAVSTLKGAIFGYKNELITKELVNKIPYASSILTIGKGSPGLVILESKDEDKEIWVSSDGIYIVIDKGRIIKTKGLFNNITDLRFIDIDVKKLSIEKTTENLIYYYSYDIPQLIDMKVEVQRKYKGLEKVDLLKGESQLHLIEEDIKNNFIGWNITNKYWMDDNSYVWKSEQYISPKLPKFILEVTKKPAI